LKCINIKKKQMFEKQQKEIKKVCKCLHMQ
jgi:hypothetical protein